MGLRRLLLGVMAASLVFPSRGLAAADPTTAVTDVVDALVAKDFQAMPELLCDSKRQALLASYDLSAVGGLADDLGQRRIDAMTIELGGGVLGEYRKDGDAGGVYMDVVFVISFDEAIMSDLVHDALLQRGLPADGAAVAAALPSYTGSLVGAYRVATLVDVIREEGEWVACDDFLGDAVPVEGSTPYQTESPSYRPDASVLPVSPPS